MTNPQAGWYEDPVTPQQHRYWDGRLWTKQVRPAEGDAPAPTPLQMVKWEAVVGFEAYYARMTRVLTVVAVVVIVLFVMVSELL